MLSPRLERLLSLGAGCCVLWLMTAQQKLCPWLYDDQPAEHSAHADPAPPAPQPVDADATPDESDKTEPRLPLLLPDSRYTAAPRWSAGSAHASAREATGHRDGVRIAGPRHTTDDALPPAASSAALSWTRWQIPHPYLGLALDTTRAASPRDPALHTCIRRLGPPCTCA